MKFDDKPTPNYYELLRDLVETAGELKVETSVTDTGRAFMAAWMRAREAVEE